MASRILIIWPDAEHAQQLYQSLTQSGLRAWVEMVREYPEPQDLTATLEKSGSALAAVIVGLGGERAYEILRELRLAYPSIVIAAADAAESTESLRSAMRAGATEYLTPPFSEESLHATFAEAARNADAGGGAGVTISFVPAQGSDGASTIALQVAHVLSSDLGQPALFVDCDVHCGTTAFRLGRNPPYNLSDALLHAENVSDLWERVVVRWKGLHMLCAPETGLRLDRPPMDNLPDILAAASRDYPYVIADLPPVLAGPYEQVLVGSDLIYLVCTPGLTSLRMARRKLNEIRGFGIHPDLVRLVLSRADARGAASRNEVAKVVGIPVHFTIPNDYQAIARATMEEAVISDGSALGEQLYKLAAKIAGAEGGNEAHPKKGWKKILGF